MFPELNFRSMADILAGTPGSNIPHALFHFDVITDGDTPYRRYHLCFASLEIEQRVSSYIETQDMNEFTRWMNWVQFENRLGPVLGLLCVRLVCFSFGNIHCASFTLRFGL